MGGDKSAIRRRHRSSSEGRIGCRRSSVQSNLYVQTLRRNSNNELPQQLNNTEIKSNNITTDNYEFVVNKHKLRRSLSTRSLSFGSSDSSYDSDGQLKLCTPDHCVMDKIKKRKITDKPKSETRSASENREHIYLLHTSADSKGGERKNTLLSTTLCKYCGGEMKKTKPDELLLASITKKSGLRYKCLRFLGRVVSDLIPAWLTEPEYNISPKPKAHSNAVHHHTDSLLSTSSGFTNYYGFLNLCLILLVLSNARLFLENIMKYGVLVNFSFIEVLYMNPYYWPNLALTLSLAIYPAIALLTEILLAKSYISNHIGFIAYVINLGCLLVIPAATIYYLHPIILFSMFTLGCTTMSFLKLISYGHTNYWYRYQTRSSIGKLKRRRSLSSPGDEKQSKGNSPTKEHQVYPENINVKDLSYYMFAPTLCYELNFPRSARIRKRFLIKRFLEMIFLMWLSVCLVQQWIVPTVTNAKQPLAQMEVFKMLERLLKLSIPNHFIWLIFFYWFFHSALNIIAELTRFGDREFYKDWWNADSVTEFWKHWNIPVHRFGVRHIYKPLLSKGFGKVPASCAVFFISAFFHEYLVSVPLHMFKIWAFTGMFLQVPMAVATSCIHGKWGNICMWLSVILGQPVAILAYFHDYYINNTWPAMSHDASAAAS